MNYPGFYQVPRGEIGVIDIREEGSVHSLFYPTDEEIEKACEEHGFIYDYVMEIIDKRAPDIYAILFDAPVFRQYCLDRLQGKKES